MERKVGRPQGVIRRSKTFRLSDEELSILKDTSDKLHLTQTDVVVNGIMLMSRKAMKVREQNDS